MKKRKLTATAPLQDIFICGDETLAEECAELIRKHSRAVLPPNKFTALNTSKKTIGIAIEVTNFNPAQKRKNLMVLDTLLPPSVPIISSSLTITALEQSRWITQKERLIGFGAMPFILQNSLIELAPALSTADTIAAAVQRFFESLGKETAIVQDRIGMVLPRILCQIINEALLTTQQGIASPGDIDLAMTIGSSYPHGPIAWGEKIGFDTVAAILDALHNDLGEERYRVVPLLKQLSLTGKFWGKAQRLEATSTSVERPTQHKDDLHKRPVRKRVKKKQKKR